MKKNQKKPKNRLEDTRNKTGNIAPLGDKVLIKVANEKEQEKKNAFGIIIPDTINKEKPEQGRVVAVGEGKMTDTGTILPMKVKIGDKVVFSKYGYDEVKIDDEEFILVSESSILAIIK